MWDQEIGLGDLAKAFGWLRPEDHQIRLEILALLGLGPHRMEEEPAAILPSSQEIESAQVAEPEADVLPSGSEPSAKEATAEGEFEVPEDHSTIRSILQRLDPLPSMEKPDWLGDVEILKEDPDSRTRPELERLLNPLWIRSILTAMLSAPAADGPVDVEALVDILTNAEPIVDIPRMEIPTLRNGVQLLIDDSEAMAPFMRDQQLLVTDLVDVVGEDNLQIGYFQRCPTRDVQYEDADKEEPYTPPAAGAIVLVLTDLGIGRLLLPSQPATTSEWRAFARAVREGGCSLVALVPYERQRWPRVLVREMIIVHWDRRTSAGTLGQRPSPRPRRGPRRYGAQSLDRLARRNPDAVELAKMVSLAARIEPDLLRAARLRLLPDADAGAEADLWFSSLVQVQSRSAMLLAPAAVSLLRDALVAEGEQRVKTCWDFLEGYRADTGASYAIRLEEKIGYLALRHGADSHEEVTRLLRQAQKALVEGEGDRGDLARWALRAVPALPGHIRNLPAARELYYAANVRLKTLPIPERDLPADPQGLRWLVPPEPPTVPIGARLVPDGVVFSYLPGDRMHRIPVPRTDPRMLDLSWNVPSGEETHRLSLGPGQKRAIRTGPGPIIIETIFGQRFELLRGEFLLPLDYSRFLDPSRIPEEPVREEALAAVDDWLADPSRPRALLFSGGPGSSKMTLSADLVQISQRTGPPPEVQPQLGPGFLGAMHFCMSTDDRYRDPLLFVESISAQLANRYVAFADALQEEARSAGRPALGRKTAEVGAKATDEKASERVKALAELRDILAGLYPELQEGYRVVTEAGLDPAFIEFTGRPITTWFNILEDAQRRDKVQAIVDVARMEYPRNQELGRTAGLIERDTDGDVDTIYLRLDMAGLSAAEAWQLYLHKSLESLYKGGFDEQIIVLVDAVDESVGVSQEQRILTLLERARDLPAGVRLILTAQPTPEVSKSMVEHLRPVVFSLDAPAPGPQWRGSTSAKIVKWFVNREKQIRAFLGMLERRTLRQIMFVEAPTGMGKTWLIERLNYECKAREVPVAHFDFWDRRFMDYLAMVGQVRDQLGPAHFDTMTKMINDVTSITVNVELESQRRRDVNITLPDAADSQVTIGDVAADSIVKDNFFKVRADGREVWEMAKARILDSFFNSLRTLSQEQVTVFLFDTYEEAQGEARQWVEGELLLRVRQALLPNVLVVLAGQKTPSLDRSAWDQFLVVTDLALFTHEDVRQYLEMRGLKDLDLDAMVAASGGHPARLAEIVDTARLSPSADEEEDWL